MPEERGSVFKIVKVRLMWLSLGLLISLFVSKYIHQFEEILQKNILVVTFIPLVVYLADAIGTQMESIIIRAFSKENKFSFPKFFYRQVLIVALLGIALGILGAAGSYIIYKDVLVSLGLGVSIFASALTALLTGTVFPFLFWKLHEDPAEASGPVATVIQDALSILIYFTIFHSILN